LVQAAGPAGTTGETGANDSRKDAAVNRKRQELG
jgi:hypothetical protein